MSDEIRVGDRFEITVEVVADEGSALGLRAICVRSASSSFYLSSSELLSGRRLPRTIKVGDRVVHKRAVFFPPPMGVVQWVDGTHALVRWPDSDPARSLLVESVTDLTPIPGDEK